MKYRVGKEREAVDLDKEGLDRDFIEMEQSKRKIVSQKDYVLNEKSKELSLARKQNQER